MYSEQGYVQKASEILVCTKGKSSSSIAEKIVHL